MAINSWANIDDRKFKESFTIHDVRAFRNRTPIGTRVRFEVEDFVTGDNGGTRKVTKHVEGETTGKVPQVVVLDGKYTYTWKDLMLNNVEIIEN